MTRQWRLAKLGELVAFKTGKLDSNAAVPNGDYPFFTCSQETLRTNTYSFDTECVLLAGNNANGIYPLKYFQGKFDAYQRTYVVTTRDPDRLTTRFLYFALRPKLEEFRSISTGAATKFLTMTILNETEIQVPPLAVQRRIAGILSAYDELIENSQRRIRILESMARGLYREWFVDFRFPGDEKCPLVASPLGDIPKGWEVAELASVCAEGDGIQTGPFGSQLHKSDYSDEGVPVVMPKDLISFRIVTDRIARIPNETADKLCRHRMRPGDIVYGRRGDIGRRAYLMSHQAGWFCGTGCLRIRPNQRSISGWYLFNHLGQDDVAGIIAARAQGVTMPNLSAGVMSSVPLKLPPRELQVDFERLTFPMAEASESLVTKIENLRRTRDLLLPRLLSGQVELGAQIDIS